MSVVPETPGHTTTIATDRSQVLLIWHPRSTYLNVHCSSALSSRTRYGLRPSNIGSQIVFRSRRFRSFRHWDTPKFSKTSSVSHRSHFGTVGDSLSEGGKSWLEHQSDDLRAAQHVLDKEEDVNPQKRSRERGDILDPFVLPLIPEVNSHCILQPRSTVPCYAAPQDHSNRGHC